ERVGAFDLDAEKLQAVVEDEVVALAVAPGAGHAEAQVVGLFEVGGFGTLSDTLGVGAVGGAVGQARSIFGRNGVVELEWGGSGRVDAFFRGRFFAGHLFAGLLFTGLLFMG